MSDFQTFTAAEVAANLRVSVETVYRKCKTGEWKATKVGRLYRFTSEQYEAITEPPIAQLKPRTQRDKIAKLLRSA